jgi:hypothetical protein
LKALVSHKSSGTVSGAVRSSEEQRISPMSVITRMIRTNTPFLGKKRMWCLEILNQLNVLSYSSMDNPFADHYESQFGFRCLITVSQTLFYPTLIARINGG